MIRKSVDVIRAAATEQKGYADQVIDPPKVKARFLENAADLERAAKRMEALEAVAATMEQFVSDGYIVLPQTLEAFRAL
jgi:hypothetical protein